MRRFINFVGENSKEYEICGDVEITACGVVVTFPTLSVDKIMKFVNANNNVSYYARYYGKIRVILPIDKVVFIGTADETFGESIWEF